ncbi:MAG: hypothetical protein WC495_03040 [Patescibacteria group bacterium]
MFTKDPNRVLNHIPKGNPVNHHPAGLDELAAMARQFTPEIDEWAAKHGVNADTARRGGIAHAPYLLDEKDWTVCLLFGVTDASRPKQHGVTGIMAVNTAETRCELFGRGGYACFNPPADKSIYGQFTHPWELKHKVASLIEAIKLTEDGMHTIIERVAKTDNG